MTIRLECLECGETFKVSIKDLGGEPQCPECGSIDIDLAF